MERTSISAAADGTYTITLTAVDKAGNMATGSFILVWDTAPPAITIGNPGNSTAQSKKVSAYSPDGVLSIAVTTGSVCDSSLSFNQSPMMTFSSESGNKAVQVTRAVAVFDDYLPAILVCIAILVVVGGVGAYLVYARKKHGL